MFNVIFAIFIRALNINIHNEGIPVSVQCRSLKSPNTHGSINNVIDF